VRGRGEPVRVLLVGSDPRGSALLAAMLRATWKEGLVLSHAERLADAIHELLERGASFVIVDGSSVEADPLSTIEQLQTAAPDIPVVILTDQADEQLAVDVIRAGAQDCLPKVDLNPSALRRAVCSAIERKRAETRLVHQALHDPLTGLPNRALFLDRLGVALDRARRSRSTIAVMFLDVDNFKEINDSMGHPAGDRLLIGLAERLRGMLRPMDTVARFGGDEFTCLFEDLASEREAVLIAERISRATTAPIAVGADETAVTLSIGIAVVPDPSTAAEAVIREADAAMYRAKEHGRARYELFDESARQRASERLALESELRHAIARAELRVHYQPRVTLQGAIEVIGFEALVRWQHPRRGLLAPEDFIPLAEETGMVMAIGQFVVEEALHQVARWRRFNPRVTVAVNLSARQLEDLGLPSMLAGAMRAGGGVPEALCLEVSERALSGDPETAIRALSALKALGVKLGIDDYGTGSTSLQTLRRLPIDALNIDRSFIDGVDSDPVQTTIVETVVKLGHAVGLSVVAEGVETEEQLEQLQALGCDHAQGYLFSGAVPEDEADALMLSD
jgi:diguanylate cyclase (GGDEF)-like protein